MNALAVDGVPPGLAVPVPRTRPHIEVIDGRGPKKKQGLIDAWLDHMIRRWAGQKRAMWQGSDRSGHEFGWASATAVLGKIHQERDGSAETALEMHYAEFYTEDALLVRRALEDLEEDPLICLHLHYIVPASVSTKAREAGYSPAAYWNYLKAAHAWVEGRIRLLDPKVSRQSTAR